MGLIYPPTIPIGFTFNVQTAAPIDPRGDVATFNDLLSPTALPYIYKYCKVRVHDEDGQEYKWNGLDRTQAENWLPCYDQETYAPALTTLTPISDVVTWDVKNKGQAVAEVSLGANSTLTINNAVSGGAYLLRVTKTVVTDVQITLTGTFKKSSGTGFLTNDTILLVGEQNGDFLLDIAKIGTVNYISIGY